MTRRIKIVCNECGGTNVHRDATAVWDTENQCWELGSVMDQGYCDDCSTETRLDEKQIDATWTVVRDAEALAQSGLYEVWNIADHMINLGKYDVCIARRMSDNMFWIEPDQMCMTSEMVAACIGPFPDVESAQTTVHLMATSIDPD